MLNNIYDFKVSVKGEGSLPGTTGEYIQGKRRAGSSPESPQSASQRDPGKCSISLNHTSNLRFLHQLYSTQGIYPSVCISWNLYYQYDWCPQYLTAYTPLKRNSYSRAIKPVQTVCNQTPFQWFLTKSHWSTTTAGQLALAATIISCCRVNINIYQNMCSLIIKWFDLYLTCVTGYQLYLARKIKSVASLLLNYFLVPRYPWKHPVLFFQNKSG